MNNRQDAKSAMRRELFDAQDAIDQQREDLIGKIEKQLKHTFKVRNHFAIRWTLCEEGKSIMSKRKSLSLAICYDFDGTLSPGNMQEHSYFPEIDTTPKEFWEQAKARAKEHDADEILAYMRLMIEKATVDTKVKVTHDSFSEYGNKLSFFDGVPEWFARINNYGKEQGAKIEHYIISSGIKDMIEGTAIAKHFKKIYASAFMYDQHGVAYWPAQAVNYTTKTQFLFRINKGQLDAWDNSQINAFVPKTKRHIPFTRMIYIGDGSTDVPCMKLVKAQGGYSIAVYQPRKTKMKRMADQLLKDDRVHYTAPADYTDGSLIDRQVKAVIRKMVAEHAVVMGPSSARQATVAAAEVENARVSDPSIIYGLATPSASTLQSEQTSSSVSENPVSAAGEGVM